MKCQKCQNEAIVHITKVINNTKKEYHLCEECARVEDAKIDHVFHAHVDSLEEKPTKVKVTTEQEVVAGMIDQLGEIAADILGGKRKVGNIKSCPKCGLTLQDFMRTGKFGCPYDYEFFAEELKPIIERLHGGRAQHVGKFPKRSITVEKQIQMLETEMKAAIKSENYERAAEIRDQLKDLQKQEGVDVDTKGN